MIVGPSATGGPYSVVSAPASVPTSSAVRPAADPVDEQLGLKLDGQSGDGP
jgi:hypothetical protein